MKRQLNIFRLFTFVVVLALAVIIAVGATFSWSPRTVDNGTFTGSYRSLEYEFTGRINNFKFDDTSVATYEGGISDNGKIIYKEEAVSGEVAVESNTIKYFKTVINNSSNTGSALFSLYIDGMKYSNDLGENINIGIFTPEKTYDSSLTAASSDGTGYVVSRFCLEDNLFVKNNDTCTVYWFVKIDNANAVQGTIDIGTVQLICN